MTVGAGSVVEGPFLPDGLVVDWPFSFVARTDDEVAVRLVTPTASSVPAFTVTRANVEHPDQPGGVVTIDPPLQPADGKLWISLRPTMAQGVAFEDQARFSPTVMNGALDLAASRDQYLDARLDRAQKVRLGETAPEIPPQAVRAGAFRLWSDDGALERTDVTAAAWFATTSAVALLQAAVKTLQVQVASLFSLLSRIGQGGGRGSGVGLDLGLYLNPADALSDAQVAAYVKTGTVGWANVADQLRQAFADAGAAGLPVDATRVRGMYYVDPGPTAPDDLPWPILIRSGSGFIGPETAKCQLAYTVTQEASQVEGEPPKDVVQYRLNNPGLTFIVDTHSARKDTPWFARQGGTVIRGLQIAGVGLLNDVGAIDVTDYKTTGIVGAPTDHAPVLVTDHRHDGDGALAASSKAGITTCQAHIVGVMQAAYHGDPLPQEEAWAYRRDADGHVVYDADGQAYGVTGSGAQTGIGFTEELTLTATPMKRVLGVARSTAGGFKCSIQAIPPWGTFMSQPNSGGSADPRRDYALLKWFQKNGTVLDRWHRMVGFDIHIEARGFRYGDFVRGGFNPLGPAPDFQDTGKYNGGKISFGCERVITAVHVEPDAYLHRYEATIGGHFMDEYNLNGETGALIEIMTDGQKAGAIDKSLYPASVLAVGNDYSLDDKVSDIPPGVTMGDEIVLGQEASDPTGYIFACTAPGPVGTPPTASGSHFDPVTGVFTDPGSVVRWVSTGKTANVFACKVPGHCSVEPVPYGDNYDGDHHLFTDPYADPVDGTHLQWVFRNGGFKPVGESPFAIASFKGVVQETSGPVFVNTANDGHKYFDLSGLDFQNWSQAKNHHDDAAIQWRGPDTLIIHHNARVSASATSQKVYDGDLSNLWVQNNGYFGYDLQADGSDPPAIAGTDTGSRYFRERGCEAFNFGMAVGDDPDPDTGSD